jgi:hypothetical protein
LIASVGLEEPVAVGVEITVVVALKVPTSTAALTPLLETMGLTAPLR